MVWTNHLPKNAAARGMSMGVGVKFLDLEEEDRKLILEYIHKNPEPKK